MDELPEEEKRAIPAWVVTFADLMSLLMCFFVLLLSFSEIDAQKFKQIAGELSKAFGVQREIPALEIPMGTSPIFDKFSPAPPEPTVVNEIRQTTTDQQPQLQTLNDPTEQAVQDAIQEQMDANLAEILEVLEPAIMDGRINVSEDQRRIVIRVEEKGSFPSGSAQLTWEFEGLLLDMAEVLADMPGDLAVEGHTDNIPIRTERFFSNWDLSAARAAAVANVLLARDQVSPERLRVTGLADTRPRVANTTADNRAKNRRVEIIIDLSGPLEEQEIRLRELIEAEQQSQEAIIDLRSEQASPSGDLVW
ncbi:MULTISPECIES: flagellar motor protein MotB [Marinobacter]|jgi:chemotaxis protein MotB|uniref:Flagellar motor protein MotB n=3 Tax=Marinobacter TaxID=2742 RepID=A0A455W0V7_MARNT|nr:MULTISPECIES: flagellar motor protein MotB [Marinobacter]WBU41564.1 flagellar motor protein MotB [Marinobacter alkaliphilus]BBJ02500.1 flagellar motor protein MotB [Marinobacter nauticus]KXO10662.1 Flagellar motor rotation protein MotB [Marinobacter excellens LAMA 842]KXO11326.1 Flagellar motor rotation protein MotB [Marinobacter excellens LAMA 842]MAO12063.1 type VI secretion system protein TssL [Marinobacter sp.]